MADRAYLEIRDDPELTFVCRSAGPPLPPPLRPTAAQRAASASFNAAAAAAAAVAPPPPADHAAAIAAAAATATTALAAQGYDEWDILHVPPATDPRRVPPPPPSLDDVEPRAACFPGEKEFKARMNVLLDALGEAERKRAQLAACEVGWEEEWAREQRGEAPREAVRPSKLRRTSVAEAAPVEQKRSFADALRELWNGAGAFDGADAP
jgi:hypothetical protein